MVPVKRPLDWWAYGGYKEVMRQTGRNIAKAYREAIKAYGWNSIGHTGYQELCHRIMDSEVLEGSHLTRFRASIANAYSKCTGASRVSDCTKCCPQAMLIPWSTVGRIIGR